MGSPVHGSRSLPSQPITSPPPGSLHFLNLLATSLVAVSGDPCGVKSDAYSFSEISRFGEGSPRALWQNRPTETLALVSEGHDTAPAIAACTGEPIADVGSRLQALADVGVLRPDGGGRYRLGVVLLTEDRAALYMPVRLALLTQTVRAVDRFIAREPALRQGRLAGYSLLTHSNVPLDSYVINDVEDALFGDVRPERGGGRFWAALFHRPGWRVEDGTKTEGIYGNSVSVYGAVAVNAYSNRERSGHALRQFGREDLGLDSSAPQDAAVVALKRLAESYARFALEGAAPDPHHGDLLRRVGWISDAGAPTALVLTHDENRALEEAALRFVPDLAAIVRAELPFLRAVYDASPYADEVSFPEYVLFWYHVFYSRVTDALVATEVSSASPSSGGHVEYLVLPEGWAP